MTVNEERIVETLEQKQPQRPPQQVDVWDGMQTRHRVTDMLVEHLEEVGK